MKNIHPAVQAAIVKHLTPADQIRFAVSKDWTVAQTTDAFGPGSPVVKIKYMLNDGKLTIDGVSESQYVDELAIKTVVLQNTARNALTKSAVPATTTANASALYYPTQAAGVILPPTTTPIITALANMGAPQFKPDTRVLTQSALLSASEIAEGDAVPAAAPDVEFQLTALRKAALILVFNNELLAADNYGDSVQAYVQAQLEYSVNNRSDAFVIGMLNAGNAAATVAAGMAGFAGDLRTACWIGSPDTLATLQSAANPNVGPRGGVFMTLPAVPTMAAAGGKLYLVDVTRTAVFDGPQFVERSEEADLIMDTVPDSAASAPVRLYQSSKTALKITKYYDAKPIVPATVITLA